MWKALLELLKTFLMVGGSPLKVSDKVIIFTLHFIMNMVILYLFDKYVLSKGGNWNILYISVILIIFNGLFFTLYLLKSKRDNNKTNKDG